MTNRPLHRRLASTWMSIRRVIALSVLLLVALDASLAGSALRAFVPGTTHAAAGINPLIHDQGKVSSSNGVAVANGSYNMKFKSFGALTGGNALWTETCYARKAPPGESTVGVAL